MKYKLVTERFGHSMWFMPCAGKGFRISSDPKDGIVIEGIDQAIQEAARLRIASGMDVRIEKVKSR